MYWIELWYCGILEQTFPEWTELGSTDRLRRTHVASLLLLFCTVDNNCENIYFLIALLVCLIVLWYIAVFDLHGYYFLWVNLTIFFPFYFTLSNLTLSLD